jgi:hypothetical protein
VVANARDRFRRQEVAGRGLEELEHRLVRKRGRVRDIDDDGCAREGVGETFTGDGIHSRPG